VNLKIAAIIALFLIVFFLVPFAHALQGDVNGDGKVDMKDVALVVQAFGSYTGSPRWNAACDVYKDGRIDLRDLAVVLLNFGKS
jgi:hypothetical protein